MIGILAAAVVVLLVAVGGVSFWLIRINEDIEEQRGRIVENSELIHSLNGNVEKELMQLKGIALRFEAEKNALSTSRESILREFREMKESCMGTADTSEFLRMKTVVYQEIPKRLDKIEFQKHGYIEIQDGLVGRRIAVDSSAENVNSRPIRRM